MTHRILRVIVPVLGFALPAAAGTVRITPDMDHLRFQEVIDTAVYGDTVWVAPGEYLMAYMRNGIRLIAEAGPHETTIRNSRYWVIKADQVDSLTVVEGFTLDGVKAAEGVVYAENSKIQIRDCVLKNGWSGVRSMYSDVTVQNCTITDCQNGVYLFESEGRVLGNEIYRCINGITMVSSSPIVQRNDIHNNSLGIRVSEHSDPSIGGSLSTANRVYANVGGSIKNEAYLKRSGLRTMKPMTLLVPLNFWGSDCPDSLDFRGPVSWTPWVDETGTRTLETCEAAVSE